MILTTGISITLLINITAIYLLFFL